MTIPIDPTPTAPDVRQFVRRFGGVYELSPWIAERVFALGLTAADADPAKLAHRMAAVVEAANQAEQMALLRAHPELVGKIAVRGDLTADSQDEQASAGLDRCTPAEFARFQQLNDAYNKKFGFPFIIAVRGLTRGEILAEFERRVGREPAQEFRTALDQVHRIARLRLEAMARAGKRLFDA